jgi:anthranilate synthase component 1
MKIISRYLLKTLFSYFLTVALIWVIIFAFFDLLSDIGNIDDKYSLTNALYVVSLRTPYIVYENIIIIILIAGDIFQANLSRKWQAKLKNNPDTIDIYHKLRKVNPAPFSAFASFAGFEIISSSPERLFSVENNIIQTRPIAGTRPRGDKISDDKLKTELSTNLKEQAEHLMLLDLERNDLGRVCEYGSVKVDEVMSIESYAFVHHIVSNISGKLKKNTTFADIITALFPGGTITGCPKIRSMQIIAELENKPRDAYTGSLGYISNCGKMDFNILIRTIIKQNDDISISAGAGIVYDSDPEKETLETEHKAIGMLKVFN